MESFTFEALPTRVIFGFGTLSHLPQELARLSVNRALILSTPQQHAEANRIKGIIGSRAAGLFAGAVMHTPVEVTEAALVVARELSADAVVAVGGGSTTGLGKAIALRTDLPQVVIPTTYAGSEMTPILGETSGGVKTTQKSPKILPELVIYDVSLTQTLPPDLSAASGMNAVAHAVEALYASDTNPIIALMAEDAVAKLARALPRIKDNPQDSRARFEALYGAWLSGVCLGSVGMALHHKLCHVLGGAFDLPHAETHAVVLPYVVAYNSLAAPDAIATVARAINAPNAAAGLYELAFRLGIKRSLKALGMPESGLDRATELAIQNQYWNPRSIDRQSIYTLIANAWAGNPPDTSTRTQTTLNELKS